MLGKVRLALWVLVGIAALALAWFSIRPPSPPRDIISRDLPLSTIGGPFTMVGSDGRPFSSASLSGRPYVLFFGFTNCPDVCPTTLSRLARLRQSLGKGDEAFNIVLVTVDPERDGPAEMGAYTKLFGTPVIGLTGSPAQIGQIKKQFGVYSAKAPQPGGGYNVDHTATVFLMDKAGKFVATLSREEGDAVALDKLRRIVP